MSLWQLNNTSSGSGSTNDKRFLPPVSWTPSKLPPHFGYNYVTHAEPGSGSLTFLWIIDFDYATRLHHGGMIRFLNYSRELMLRGHHVYFATTLEPEHRIASMQWFGLLKEQGVITEFLELSYEPQRRHFWMAARAVHPRAGVWFLRRFQAETLRTTEDLIQKLGIDLVLLSNRRLLFLAPYLPKTTPCFIDFCDCATLAMARELRHLLRNKNYRQAMRTLPHLLRTLAEDRYYSSRSTANLVVSPIDQWALIRVARKASTVHAIPNGVRTAAMAQAQKDPKRLIFSGNMNFPPNCTAALWFLDNVFPLIVKEIPDVYLVLAGANPPEELQRRASHNVRVTGYVPDLNREIAQSALYVAPLKTGSGFNNKIVEAITNHTYVVATPIAVEFLDPYLRSLIPSTDSPQKMASHIVDLLRAPEICEFQLSKLWEHVSTRFTWSRRTDELLEIIRQYVPDGRRLELTPASFGASA